VVVILPGDAGGRGRQDGEVSELEALWLIWNSSPELRSRTARSWRGWAHCPRAQARRLSCLGGSA
jgi:hypothetical protein